MLAFNILISATLAPQVAFSKYLRGVLHLQMHSFSTAFMNAVIPLLCISCCLYIVQRAIFSDGIYQLSVATSMVSQFFGLLLSTYCCLQIGIAIGTLPATLCDLCFPTLLLLLIFVCGFPTETQVENSKKFYQFFS